MLQKMLIKVMLNDIIKNGRDFAETNFLFSFFLV